MTTGRTVLKWANVFVDGVDLTGYTRTFGPLTWEFQDADATTLGDAVKNALANVVTINPGTINSVMDNSTGANHALLDTQATRIVMLPIGIRAAPAQGDPCFMGQFMQKDFMHTPADGSAVTISNSFSGWAGEGTTLLYSKPWGYLLHAKGTETAANTAIGIDDNGSATSAKGGFMVYHLFSSDGTVNLKTQDAGTNADGSFSDLATTGLINASVTPKSGLVALGTGATVNKFLRWQIALGTATTCSFAIGFVRQL